MVLIGCVRREGRNSNCEWPRNGPVAGERELRADLEFAEELAVRYMDEHYGPGDPTVAAQAKNRCLAILLAEIGKEHGVSGQEAFSSFGKRSAMVDLAMACRFFFSTFWRQTLTFAVC